MSLGELFPELFKAASPKPERLQQPAPVRVPWSKLKPAKQNHKPARRGRSPYGRPEGSEQKPSAPERVVTLPVISPCELIFRRDREIPPRPPGPCAPGVSLLIGTRSGVRRDLAVGIDLGTSRTKVVIRDLELKDAWAVPLGELAGQEQRYFLESTIHLSADGVFRLSGKGHVFQDFKTELVLRGDTPLPVREGFPEVTPLEVTAAYLAYVSGYVRLYAQTVLAKRLKNNDVFWNLNIGMPSNSISARKISKGFRVALLAGWIASFESMEPSVGEVRRALGRAFRAVNGEDADELREAVRTSPDRVHAQPEIIAEVSGYARSPLRREGLHVLVDAGAGTLDVATFGLLEHHEEDRYPVFEAGVYALGAARLYRHRCEAASRSAPDEDARQSLASHLKRSGTISGGQIPDLAEIAPWLQATDVEAIENEYFLQLAHALRSVIMPTVKKRSPGVLSRQRTVPVFVCGGGARVEAIRSGVQRSARSIGKNPNQWELINIPTPENFSVLGIGPEAFDRLAVADGLACGPFDFGDVVAPDAIPDVEGSARMVETESLYVGAEQT